jgi:DNA polymerase
MDFETGTVHEDAFVEENELFSRAKKIRILNKHLRKCTRCDDLNVPNFTESAPGFGNLMANIMFVGQSLCTVCMQTQMPFTQGSGYLLDAVLRLLGVTRYDVFITNLVHCHPKSNAVSTKEWKQNCWAYLEQEIDIVRPKVIVALGADAKQALMRHLVESTANIKVLAVKHPASFQYSNPEARKDWVLGLVAKLEKYV